MNYWLFKSEPNVFSWDDLENSPRKTSFWEGVRNYQARNYLRDQVKTGDLVLFYHSRVEPIGIVGVAEITRAGYPDAFAFDPNHKYYDPKSKKENPTWYGVDVTAKLPFPRVITLAEIKKNPALSTMVLVQKGSRLSIQPVTKKEFATICRMAEILIS